MAFMYGDAGLKGAGKQKKIHLNYPEVQINAVFILF